MYFEPYSYQHETLEHRQPHQLLNNMTKAINDEFQAIQYYTRLAELAPNEHIRQTILEIRQDEIKHFYRFSRDYLRLAGKYPSLSLGVQLPNSFHAGVRDSLKDERETVPFYHRIASQVSVPQIKQDFLGAAQDEHRHEQIFSQISSSF